MAEVQGEGRIEPGPLSTDAVERKPGREVRPGESGGLALAEPGVDQGLLRAVGPADVWVAHTGLGTGPVRVRLSSAPRLLSLEKRPSQHLSER